MKQEGKVGGFKIRTINYVMILVACVLYGFLLYETVQIFNRYQMLENVTVDYIRSNGTALLLMQGSDVLTEEVRLYTVTGDIENAKAYFYEANVDRKRDRGLEEMRTYHSNDQAYGYLEEAMRYSLHLMEREYYAMTLTAAAQGHDVSEIDKELTRIRLSPEDIALSRDDKMAKAREMVFGKEYRDEKALIQSNVDYCISSVLGNEDAQQQRSAGLLSETISRQRICITLLFVMNIFFFFFVSVLIIRPLQVYIKCIGDNRTLQIIGSYEFKYLALTYNNIYELNAANEVMLRNQAERDGLTGLLNRRAFDTLCTGLRDCKVGVTFLLIDVDCFKQVNDTYGHDTGDMVLRNVAGSLKENFRNKDFVARIGGDEFSVIMTETTEQMREMIRKKIDGLNDRLQKGDGKLPPVSLSVGVAYSPQGFEEGLYQRADAALYRSKENGRCQCSFYEELSDAT